MRLLCILFILLLPLPLAAQTQQKFMLEEMANRRYEAGVIAGEPTGVSGKYWIDPRNAIDAAAAWLFESDGQFTIYADYLYHYLYVFSDLSLIPLYAGIGPAIQFGNGTSFFGIRIPVGAQYFLSNAPISFFAEIGPRIDITPSSRVRVTGGLGARYVF
jgi:hypothetical protein